MPYKPENISKAVNSETKVEANGDITALSSSDAKKIVDDAEKELKAKSSSTNNTATSNTKTESEMIKDKQASINASQVKLPPSGVISKIDFNYQNTIGVVKLNDNYYVGYYCGLKEVWDAATKASHYAITMQVYNERGESNTDNYRELFYDIKKLTPYIKSIQDMSIETAYPETISLIIKNYMIDTARMNLRYIPSSFYIKIANDLCDHNAEYYEIATNPENIAKELDRKDAMDYSSTLPADRYPALNVVLK
jgi:hypothetical protein